MKDRLQRNRREIFIEFLRAVLNGESVPTRLMYKVNVASQYVNPVLDEAVAFGFLNEHWIDVGTSTVRQRRRMSITEKGKELIKLVDREEALFRGCCEVLRVP